MLPPRRGRCGSTLSPIADGGLSEKRAHPREINSLTEFPSYQFYLQGAPSSFFALFSLKKFEGVPTGGRVWT